MGASQNDEVAADKDRPLRDASGKAASNARFMTVADPADRFFTAEQMPPDRDIAKRIAPGAPLRALQRSTNPQNGLRLHGQQALPLHFLAGQFAGAPHGFRFFAGSFF
jgi:hypothetical protein